MRWNLFGVTQCLRFSSGFFLLVFRWAAKTTWSTPLRLKHAGTRGIPCLFLRRCLRKEPSHSEDFRPTDLVAPGGPFTGHARARDTSGGRRCAEGTTFGTMEGEWCASSPPQEKVKEFVIFQILLFFAANEIRPPASKLFVICDGLSACFSLTSVEQRARLTRNTLGCSAK